MANQGSPGVPNSNGVGPGPAALQRPTLLCLAAVGTCPTVVLGRGTSCVW